MRTTLLSRETKNAKKDEFLKKKIAFLEQSIQNRVRTKSSQTLGGICNFSEIYLDYDSMITPNSALNPWISGDTSIWDSSIGLVDQPNLLRVKRWAISFPELLSDPTGIREFMKFSETEFSTESLKFYLGCQIVKQTPTSQLNEIVIKYYKYN
jgi:regulator of G-protein signaling